jgi:hypothetical protein
MLLKATIDGSPWELLKRHYGILERVFTIHPSSPYCLHQGLYLSDLTMLYLCAFSTHSYNSVQVSTVFCVWVYIETGAMVSVGRTQFTQDPEISTKSKVIPVTGREGL